MFEGTLLVLLLLVASYFDLRSRRVPNPLILLGVFLGLLLSFTSVSSVGIVSAVFGFFFALLLLLPAYSFGWLGAGDVKLFGLVGLFLGSERVLDTLICISLAGGALALLFLLVSKLSGLSFINRSAFSTHIDETVSGENKSLPYALAITSGTFLTMLYPNIIARI